MSKDFHDMSAIFEKLLADPTLPTLLEELNKAMQQEQTRRDAFYEWIDESTKAEFINGEVVMHSPAKEKHNATREYLSRLIGIYVEERNLGVCRGEKAMIHLVRNSYEPDICFWKKEKSDLFDPEMSLYPAPDFVVEILSKGTKAKDRGVKFDDYALNGISEYWIIDPEKEVIEQYTLTVALPNKYTLIGKWHDEHEVSSWTIEGFKIPAQAIFDATVNRQALRGMYKR